MRFVRFVLFAASLMISLSSHTKEKQVEGPGIRILSFSNYNFGSLCGITIYGRSRHLNTDSVFNERNIGGGARCYRSVYGEGFSVNAGHLINSLTGRTDLVGIGYEVKTPSFYGAQLGFGLDVDYLWYRVPTFTKDGETRNGRTLTGALPFPFLSLSYNNKVTLYLHRLKTDIYLFSLTVKADL